MNALRRCVNEYEGELIRKIAGRSLTWFGIRGSDASKITRFSELTNSYSVISPLHSDGNIKEVNNETDFQQRIDHNHFDIDVDETRSIGHFKRKSLRHFRNQLVKTAIVAITYRPSQFLDSLYFPYTGKVQYLGLFSNRQQCFEHKPWVESGLADFGVRTIHWEYVNDMDYDRIHVLLARNPGKHVIRANRGASGVGLAILTREEDVLDICPEHTDGFIALAPLLEPSLPINVNACIACDGETIVHSASVQLIGIESCIDRPLGYCGNDFAAFNDLEPRIINHLERVIKRTGEWLSSKGYLGAFGIDLIFYDGHLLVTEINPRFQCSSPLAAEIAHDLELPDLYMDHMCAFLEIENTVKRPPLLEVTRQQSPRAQIICHNIGPYPLIRHRNKRISLPRGMRIDCLPAEDILVEVGAMLFKLVCDEAVTNDGFTLFNKHEEQIERIRTHYFRGPGG